MASGPFTVVNNALEKILDGTMSLTTDTFVAVLVAASHTAAVTDATWSDISGSEVSGTGYTTGGIEIDPLTVVETSGVVMIDSAVDPLWSSATVSAKYVYVVHRAGGSLASGDMVLGYMDLNEGGGNLSSAGADFEVVWSINGIFTVARS